LRWLVIIADSSAVAGSMLLSGNDPLQARLACLSLRFATGDNPAKRQQYAVLHDPIAPSY
jgi:hypothetical protein